MADYIDREKIFSIWRSMPAPASVTSLAAAISQTPTADVAPVRHGRWERRNMGFWDEDYAYVCSVCGEVWNLIDSTTEDNNMNYCHNCGALMDKEDDNE